MWKCEPIDDEIVRLRNKQQTKEKTRLDPEHLETLKKRRDELATHSQNEILTNKKKNKA